MNGRMYDPVIGKMLAPDINIPDPYSAVGYNRYDYALNNSLTYTDPSGWMDAAAFTNIVNKLWDTPYGGHASENGSFYYYDSDEQAEAYSTGDLSAIGSWGGIMSGGGGGGGSWYTQSGDGSSPTNIVFVAAGSQAPDGYAIGASNIATFTMGNISVAYTLNSDGSITDMNGDVYSDGQSVYMTPDASIISAGKQESNTEGIINASLGIVAGGAEWVVGGVGEWFTAGTATPLTVPLFVDGGVRMGTNAARLIGYFTGHNKMANAMPTSIGAAVGKSIDMVSGKSFYDYGVGQAIGGSANDLASFVITGGTGGAFSDFIKTPTIGTGLIYFTAAPGYILGQYDNFAGLKK